MKKKKEEKIFEINVFFTLSNGNRKKYAEGSKSYKTFDQLLEDTYILEHLKEFDGFPIINREIVVDIVD